MLVEVCANSLQSALNAEKAGADRIEICSELGVGGITPSYGLLKAVAEKISIPVRVLIRPRSGDFMYSKEEVEIMKKNIALCAEMGFDGVVSGILHDDFSLHKAKMRQLLEVSGDLKFTFHRAFDWVENPKGALKELEELGIDTVLTSGQQPKAIEGLGLLSELLSKASKLTLMPGSGINANNVHLFKEKGFKAIHLSAVKLHQTLKGDPKVPMNSTSLLSDRAIPISNVETIHALVQSVK